MRLSNLDIIKNKPGKVVEDLFNKMLFEDQETYNKEGIEFWKVRIFSVLAGCMIIFGAPLLFFGAYMFYIHGDILYSAVEILVYFIITLTIMQKSLSIRTRKYIIVLTIYFISILLLFSTGVMGAGMVCVLFSLILTGCLLDKNQAFQVVTINIIVFMALTVLLMCGYLDETGMSSYKPVWLINAITTQSCGIILIFIINSIYNGLENQTQLIKKSKDALTISDIKHKSMIANISDVIAILDENGFVKYTSTNMEMKDRWITEEFFSKPIWDRIIHEDQDKVKGAFEDLLQNSSMKKTIEARYLNNEQKVRYIDVTAVNLIEDPNIRGILINYHDITERKIKEKEIIYLNYHDSLTGLYNRTFLEREMNQLDTESQLPLSIITGDINGLKIINDTLGHTEGDKIIVAIAKILGSCCRDKDTLVRIGGDEFSILMPETSSDTAYEIIRKINSACEEYNRKVSNESYYTSISLGYATRISISEPLDSIFKAAEDHMYKRKLLEIRSLRSSLLSSMKTTLFEKSQETEEHALRLVNLSKKIGQAINLTEQQFDELELFSMLHDIGKIGIDDHILNKSGKLTEEEWSEMRKHSEIGYRIAMSSPELMHIAHHILTHHERWDGKGYPQGLSGESIPLLSRILAVVDAYDAMTEDRAYRKGMSKEVAVNEIIKNAGTQFDPHIAKIFIEIISNTNAL